MSNPGGQRGACILLSTSGGNVTHSPSQGCPPTGQGLRTPLLVPSPEHPPLQSGYPSPVAVPRHHALPPPRGRGSRGVAWPSSPTGLKCGCSALTPTPPRPSASPGPRACPPAPGGAGSDPSKPQRQELDSGDVLKAHADPAPLSSSGLSLCPSWDPREQSAGGSQVPVLHLRAGGLASRPLPPAAACRPGPVQPPLWFPALLACPWAGWQRRPRRVSARSHRAQALNRTGWSHRAARAPGRDQGERPCVPAHPGPHLSSGPHPPLL